MMEPTIDIPFDIFFWRTEFFRLHDGPSEGQDPEDRPPEDPGPTGPASPESRDFKPGVSLEERRIPVCQQGRYLVFGAGPGENRDPEGPGSDPDPTGKSEPPGPASGMDVSGMDASCPGSRIATLRSGDGLIRLFGTHGSEGASGRNVFWKTGNPPPWASDWGTDKYGHWVTFSMKGRGKTQVTQRMRWISPGRFLMGSPTDEPGRYEDEDPRHEVFLENGFWLFDTACTQALWQAVMGDNPSRFRKSDCPVEQVSWNDVREFPERIETRLPGLGLVLPSEAQWEYGCRAGTETSFCFGGDITPEQVNYNGNYLHGDYPDKGDKRLFRKQTIPVTELPPNPWGLYQMHGNVWEWTADHWDLDYREVPVDGSPKRRTGDPARRAVRGGSWRDIARLVRSGVRDRRAAEERASNLGFRCARVRDEHVPAEDGPSTGRVSGKTGTGENEDTHDNRSGVGVGIRVPETSPARYPIPEDGAFSIRTDREHHAFARSTGPRWADATGRDRFGLWATIALEAGAGEPVVQRLRWIPPGSFIMGSSESEWAEFPRYEQDKWCVRELPRHRAVLTKGYWLFDTPCTQALWQAVMGKNPSRFQGPDRPVESVTWNEAEAFLDRINGLIPYLGLSLPTEAQWEYACRAGTETATYGGPLGLKGSNHAGGLDAIAWYGGNSGVGFDLAGGCDSSDWREKQYPHTRAGTHPVAGKKPNPWGLYDMLGNVWEWCRDGLREYGEETVLDPAGPENPGQERTVRGGSWYYFARYVRAASRLQYLPGVHFDRLGFRCVSDSE